MSQPSVDAKAYYGYLFHENKKPTEVLDALLRGIAIYISNSVGDTTEKKLTPTKLASFYKAVGGNYDSLFVDVPHPSISWIYASIGCQHTLQPSSNDFVPPTVPALTKRGFVRWQSIEILLGPEEHVPFIQNAVQNFGIKHPDTGEPFPVDLPKEAFPLIPDVAIEKWHSDCAAKLRERATPEVDSASARPDLPPRPKVQTGYAHVRAGRPRGDSGYFEDSRSRPSTRPISYSHVPVAGGRPVRPKLSHSPTYRARQFLAPEEPMVQRVHRTRRRSLPENVSPISPTTVPVDLPTKSPEHESRARGHSHPRHSRRGSLSSDASSERESPHESQEAKRPRHRSQPFPYQARVDEEVNSARHAPSVPTPPDPRRRVGRSGERRDREEEDKRRSQPIPIDLSGKLSAPFMLGKRDKTRDRERDREREAEKTDRHPRSGSRNANKVSWKDLGEVTEAWRRSSKDSSQDESHSRHRSERSDERVDYKTRDREKHSDRESYRERDRDRDRVTRHHSRRNSQEDLLVRPRTRERDHERERERESERTRGTGTDRRAYRDRDRSHQSPVRGVDGRRYPSHT
ncbi:hypothetical protein GLAREA_08064 [Glarea lozoyensis ATCC 20868]|uniref:DUF7514 domain-containing protein n=1 Tax=Glarea lozoyensis (strain ATCC 20868 / MF5171) TaxID=1116229 RepID=S3CG27_GLAL2|nr:uncharacterized protein GLAREA_08064 [Glarea lozoyensis ATCC 20868]EPE24214.1 hypothetical protein GLAREA_08064 [Glarea lozoyensis ATCC 20868]